MDNTESYLHAFGYNEVASLKRQQTQLLRLKYYLSDAFRHFREDAQFCAFKDRVQYELDCVTFELKQGLQSLDLSEDFTVVGDSIVPALIDEEKAILHNGGSIVDVIKAYKERTHEGLREAKVLAEMYRDSLL